jgi:hypothetical protein
MTVPTGTQTYASPENRKCEGFKGSNAPFIIKIPLCIHLLRHYNLLTDDRTLEAKSKNSMALESLFPAAPAIAG